MLTQASRRGLPFPVPEILECKAFRDLGLFFQRFSWNFPAIFLGTPELIPETATAFPRFLREVLHGIGADGVGVKFPIFAVNCCCLPLSFRRSREKRRKRGNMRGKMRKKREKLSRDAACNLERCIDSMGLSSNALIGSRLQGHECKRKTAEWSIEHPSPLSCLFYRS